MKTYIEASHKRCIENGVLLENISHTKILKKEELKAKLNQNNELITAA